MTSWAKAIIPGLLVLLGLALAMPTVLAAFTHRVVVAGNQLQAADAFPPHTVAGRVTDDRTGAPLDQVTVEVREDHQVVRSDTTLGDGTYRVDDVPTGTYDVATAPSGYERTAREGLTVDRDRNGIDLAATPQRHTVDGEVRLSGNGPSRTIDVTFDDQAGGEQFTTRVTTGAGNDRRAPYGLHDLPTGEYRITASGSGVQTRTFTEQLTSPRTIHISVEPS